MFVMFTYDKLFTVSCPNARCEDLDPANFNAYLTTQAHEDYCLLSVCA